MLARIPEAGLGSYEARFLAGLCAFIGSSRALELIDEAPAGESILPLVAALEMDLQQCEPHHAQEVEEVAADILLQVTEIRGALETAKKAMLSADFEFLLDSIGQFQHWLERPK